METLAGQKRIGFSIIIPVKALPEIIVVPICINLGLVVPVNDTKTIRAKPGGDYLHGM